ncbi:hypothetical protein ACJMK2_044571 [Sinanodonta woodiana]|uniref:Ig-like domain-containing protein n=1 Tax=Sinanodonta woodiana TaxID=1069815 RepID=A0ABD3W2B5_SINWO
MLGVLIMVTTTVLSTEPAEAPGLVFDDSPVNVTFVSGETARLPCSVQHKGDHKIIWMSPRRILISTEKDIVIDDPRISVHRPFENEWNLHIVNVRYNDSGLYTCQVNTSPVKIKRIHLHVLVPAYIINSLSSGDTEVDEGDDVQLKCKATGNPQPNITWFRRSLHNRESKDQLNVFGEVLSLSNIQRYESGMYPCMAYNGVLPAVTRQMEVRVRYPPVIKLFNTRLGQVIGKETILECRATAYPTPMLSWKFDGKVIRGKYKHKLESYVEEFDTVCLSLRIIFIDRDDFGMYTCDATNIMGQASQTMELYEYIEPSTKAIKTTTTTTYEAVVYPRTPSDPVPDYWQKGDHEHEGDDVIQSDLPNNNYRQHYEENLGRNSFASSLDSKGSSHILHGFTVLTCISCIMILLMR